MTESIVDFLNTSTTLQTNYGCAEYQAEDHTLFCRKYHGRSVELCFSESPREARAAELTFYNSESYDVGSFRGQLPYQLAWDLPDAELQSIFKSFGPAAPKWITRDGKRVALVNTHFQTGSLIGMHFGTDGVPWTLTVEAEFSVKSRMQ